MSINVGAVDFEMLLNSNPFNRGLKSANNAIKSSGIENSLKKIGKLAIAAFSVKAITDFTKECLNLGSDLAEVQNVVGVTFGDLNSQVDTFAQNAIEQFGLGQTVAKKYVGTFGAMAKAFNFSNEEALKMSETLTGLTGDVASFYNLSSELAFTKLKSVFTGETETLKDLGIVMTQTALDEYAMANGFGKTTAKMTEQQKTALRYQFVLDKLSIAQGDFARTSDGWANQTRVLSLRFNELKASLGQGFINLFTPIVQGINWVIARLQVLADAFKTFTEFITGKKADASGGIGSTAADIANVTNSAEEASSAVSGIGGSAKKAKKELQNLANFDNLNVLQKPDTYTGSGGGVGSSGLEGLDFGASFQDSINQANSGLDVFKNKAKEILGIFKDGFEISFGDTNFDGILKHLGNIKNAIIAIWTDKDVLNSAKQMADVFLYSLGQMTGAIARIGKNIVENLVGSIDKYLSENVDRIKNFICKMFNITSDDMTLTGNLWQALGEISDVFSSDTAKQIGANIIAMFSNPFMSVIELCTKLIADLRKILFQPIIDNAEEIKKSIENTLKPIEKFTSTLADAFTHVGDTLNKVYDEHMKPLFDSIQTGLSDTFGKFLSVYNEYIAPFIERASEAFGTLWNDHLKPLFDKIGEFIGSVMDLIKTLWETILKPMIDWLVENVLPVLTPIFEAIWNAVSNLFGAIGDMIGGIIDVFKGLIDFISGVFSGDWEKAWEGIKTFFTGIWETIEGFISTIWESIKGIVDIAVNTIWSIITMVFNSIKDFFVNIWNGICEFFSTIWNVMNKFVQDSINKIKTAISFALEKIRSIWEKIWNSLSESVQRIFTNIWNFIKNIINSILGGIESMVNGVIRGINKMVDAINNIKFDIPDWVPGLGGKSFGFNIAKVGELTLPRLAEGGFVKANTPQLVMIGDNKNQGEVVAPEGKMLDMILTALKMFKAQEGEQNTKSGQAIEIILNCEGSMAQLMRLIKIELDKESQRRGSKLIIGGTS